jgi:hypothetical protein
MKNTENEQTIKRRIDFERAADEETSEADPPFRARARFVEQQSRNQKPAQDEEEVDSDPTALHPRREYWRTGQRAEVHRRVPADDEQDRKKSKEV